jgi:ribonuclease VapC
MFLDSSAMLAILMGESDAPALSDALETADRRLTSSAVRLETCLELPGRRDWAPARAPDFFDDFAFQACISKISIDERIGRLAVACFERFGKGRGPAQLNFGDCLSYACAKAHGARLLFTAKEFVKTDVNGR